MAADEAKKKPGRASDALLRCASDDDATRALYRMDDGRILTSRELVRERRAEAGKKPNAK